MEKESFRMISKLMCWVIFCPLGLSEWRQHVYLDQKYDGTLILTLNWSLLLKYIEGIIHIINPGFPLYHSNIKCSRTASHFSNDTVFLTPSSHFSNDTVSLTPSYNLRGYPRLAAKISGRFHKGLIDNYKENFPSLNKCSFSCLF